MLDIRTWAEVRSGQITCPVCAAPADGFAVRTTPLMRLRPCGHEVIVYDHAWGLEFRPSPTAAAIDERRFATMLDSLCRSA